MFKILQKQMSGTDNEHLVDTTDIMPAGNN